MADSRLRDVAQAQIVFCSMSDSTAHLDCVSQSPGTWGWPFSMVVEIPEGVEWAAAAAAMLGRWTSAARPIELQLLQDQPPYRARLSDGLNAMRLDVVGIRIKAPA